MEEAVTIQGESAMTNINIWGKTGLALPKNLKWDQWSEMGYFFNHMNKSMPWLYGDWENFGKDKWGEQAAQCFEESMYANGTLRNAAWVCRKIPMSRRREGLTYSHHYEVASLTIDEQEKFLDLAEKKQMNVKQLREAVATFKNPDRVVEASEGVEVLEPIVEDAKRERFKNWQKKYLNGFRYNSERKIARNVSEDVYKFMVGEENEN